MDRTSKPITGGCLCGAVRFSIDAEPMLTRVCWCRLCQHIGAGSATVNVVFPAGTLAIEGPVTDYVCAAESGNTMHRRFCPTCGSHLFNAPEQRADLVIIRAGALDDPNLANPGVTIWTSEAPRWACFDPDLPQTSHQPLPPPAK